LLKIRLSRTGKKSQASYRIVVQEHTAPIKGKFIELVGNYIPTQNPKVLKINAERVKHWISVGAQPSDTVATLLKREGFEGMERYIAPRDRQRKKKNAEEEEAAPAKPAAEAPAVEEKAEEAAPAEEAPAAEEKAEEAAPAEEAPAAEEKAEEAAPAEEAPAAEEKAEEAPAEEKSE
jgi:small subunit ribosomal protein S16